MKELQITINLWTDSNWLPSMRKSFWERRYWMEYKTHESISRHAWYRLLKVGPLTLKMIVEGRAFRAADDRTYEALGKMNNRVATTLVRKRNN